MRVAVVGHIEYVNLGRVPSLPRPGDIVHVEHPVAFPGGGGGVAFFQLLRGGAEVHLFTALGGDDIGARIATELAGTGGHIHAARRGAPHTRADVLVTPDGERTILVVGEPMHPLRDDPLPWDLLASCDAVYFTAQDPAVLQAARAARLVVVTARRRAPLLRSGVCADVVVGSAFDPREAGHLADYPVPPTALVQTEGAAGGWVETAAGVERFPPAPRAPRGGAAYGSGDSFAAALTWYLALGLTPAQAARRAAPHGAAVLVGLNPLDSQLALPDAAGP